ncbi:enoyl-CoA hydratase/isomerase family protein [Sphingomonas immobilis]|uniref:Enoyl-CoA hydratase-related protein n=1 Tax=Sphingomonas immobilis TaxID=3063997 RepID=A0ABT8ZYE1_9SPHN|nr:enoyl-CoA hydratase-related protein [Sphingomonas sp. CA1-15]MDO7842222.1 enoyl-CoA hydratase-related protein [Sphingomonas sp. CA1-15]
MTDLVTGTLADGVATITLNRPEGHNAMSWGLVDAFSTVAQRLAGDPGTRVFLLRAEGKNFCVGGDIRAFADEADPSDFLRRLAGRLHEGLKFLFDHPAPLVVAAQGASAGAGLSLVAGGDVVLAGRSSNFSMAYTGIGLTADGGATWLLPRVIGLRRTQELAYLGRRLNAEEAADYGLVTRIVDDAALADEAQAVAAKIAAGPTAAYGGVKRLLAASYGADFAAHLDAEAEAIATAMASADAAEGLAAFLGRRPPVFAGR